jgi:hypothetical protein
MCRGSTGVAGVRRLARGPDRPGFKRLHSATRPAIIAKAGHHVCQRGTTQRTRCRISRYRGKMSVARVIRSLLLAPLLAIVFCYASPVFAQIGGPPGPPTPPLQPLPPPNVTPPAPVQLQPLPVPTPASPLPALAPAPTVVGPIATPTPPRAFRCSCSGTGSGTQWVGVVQASNALLAGQAAQGVCIGYLASRNPGSPAIGTTPFGFSATGPFPPMGPNTIPGDVYNPTAGVTLPPGLLPGQAVPLGQTLARLRQYGATTGQLICRPCTCN